MKKKSILALTLSFVLAMTMSLASCSKEPTNLEEYIKQNPESMDQIQQKADENQLEITVTENDVVYVYDLANQEGVSEELATSDYMKQALTDALASVSSSFSGMVTQLEETSGMTGIQIIVKYVYGETVIVEQTFNASGAVEGTTEG